MTIAGERLSLISGLAGVSAAAHLKAAGHSSGISAKALLMAWSTLGSNTATVHILYDPVGPGSSDKFVTRSFIVGIGRMM